MIYFAGEGRDDFRDWLRSIEAKWQRRWKEARIFEADPDPSRPKYFLTVPYPYTSGPLHIGHGRTYTIGDVHARYMRHKGYNVLWPMAFHITGTPIEAISARIRMGDEEYIGLYRSYLRLYVDDEGEIDRLIERFKDPWEVMRFFSSVISSDFDALGYSIDWRRRFTTGDPEYNSFVSWQFIRLRERGFIVQGGHPVLYDVMEEQAVGEDDILGGDEIKPGIVEFTAVKFDAGGGRYLVAATLRPETLPGVTNVWVNPDARYVELEAEGERWVVSEEAEVKLRLQQHPVKRVRELRGRDLVGLRVRDPLVGRSVPVLPGTFVDPDEATGVVYSVPAHAPYDYAALMDVKSDPERFGAPRELVEGLEPIPIIRLPGYGELPAREACERHGVRSQEDRDALEAATEEIYKREFYEGVMTAGPFAGLRVTEAKERTREFLFERGLGFTFYEVTALKKPVISRSGGKVVVAVLPDQWFLDFNAPGWKERGRRALELMAIVPEKYRKLFEDTIEWLDKRPCARKRGIGTRLPFDRQWIIESLSDSTIYMAFYTVIHRIRELQMDPQRMGVEFWDYVFWGRGDPSELAERVGVSPEDLRRIREEFEYWYPVDHRHTMIAHITNHLTFFIMHHAALFDEDHWPRKITLNEPVIREGTKMSKSKGNVIPLVEIPRIYSADWFRLYSVSAADLATVLDWRDRDVQTVGGRLRRFVEIFRMVADAGSAGERDEGVLARWLESRTSSMLSQVDEMLANHRYRDAAIRAFFDHLRDVEVYLRYGGRDFSLLRRMLMAWSIALEPFIPHLAEEIWESLGGDGFVSLAPWPEPGEWALRPELEEAFRVVERTIEDVNKILRTVGGEKKRLFVYLASDWKYEMLSRLEAELKPPINQRDAFRVASEFLRSHGKEAEHLIREFVGAQGALRHSTPEAEREMFSALVGMIRDRTGLEEVIIAPPGREVPDPMGKAGLAIPGRPALYIE